MFVARQAELAFLNDVLARKRPTAAQSSPFILERSRLSPLRLPVLPPPR